MKRISGIILVGTMLISLTSCKPDVSIETDYESRLKSQPVVYQSGSDLYIVKEDNKPRKIVSGKFDSIADNAFTDAFNSGMSVSAKGIFKISYDHQQLAFIQPDKAENDKITLYLADTNKERVKEICDDISFFATGTTVSNGDAFKFAANGDLYYLKNNRTDTTTDLYLYRKGKSKFVASNVINFYLSEDNKKILYTGGNEYSEDNKPSVAVTPETFMAKWHYKYEPSAFTLSLYDIHTKKAEVLSSHTDVKQYNYDTQALSFVDYMEKDDFGGSVQKHYGGKSTYKGCCDNCTGNTIHINEITHIVKNESENGWFLQYKDSSPTLIEEIEINLSKLPGEYKLVQNELYFFKSDEDKVYYYNRRLATDDSEYNLHCFTVKDGVISDKKDIDKGIAENILPDSNGGVFYSKLAFDSSTGNNRMISCYYNGETYEFPESGIIRQIYNVDGKTYILTKAEETDNTFSLYLFENLELKEVDKSISDPFYANNKLYYFKQNKLYENGKLIADKIDAHVSDLLDRIY